MKNIERIKNMTEKELAHLIGVWNGGGEEKEEKYLLWLNDEYDGTDGPAIKVEDMPMKRAELPPLEADEQGASSKKEEHRSDRNRGRNQGQGRNDRDRSRERFERDTKPEKQDKNRPKEHTPMNTQGPSIPGQNNMNQNGGQGGQRRRYRYRSRNK